LPWPQIDRKKGTEMASTSSHGTPSACARSIAIDLIERTGAALPLRRPSRRPEPMSAARHNVLGRRSAACFDIEVVDPSSSVITSCIAAAMRCRPHDINRWGQRVGSLECAGCERAVLFDHGRVVDLGVLHPAHPSSRALALNDVGHVVGISRHGQHEQAFVWHDGRMSGLGGLNEPRHAGSHQQPLQSSRARDINNRGLVVGRAATDDRVFGFMWLPWRGLLDLSDLVAHASREPTWRIVEARHVDHHDRIFATGVCDGRWHDVLLTPRR
jgi:probable HAF family extracellular repeat protein